MKLCNKCLIEKEIVDFPKKGCVCKSCVSEYKKEYAKRNKDKIKEYRKLYSISNEKTIKERKKKYREENKDKIQNNKKEYYEKNKDKIKSKVEEYYQNNKDEKLKYGHEWHEKNREEILIRQKKYREENKEEISLKKKEWYQENKDKVKKYQKDNKDHLTSKKREHYHKNKDRYNELNRIYIRNKKSNNPLYKLSCSIRTLITQSFKLRYTKKAKKTIEILGCTFDEFKIHIESKFTKEMSWDNYATYWQLDHIIPVSWAKTEEEIYKLNHYTNFQPLEWRENISKGNRYQS